MAFGANRRRAEVLQSFRLDLLDPANRQIIETLQACPWGTLNQTIVDALRIGIASLEGKPSIAGRSGRRPGQKRPGRFSAAAAPQRYVAEGAQPVAPAAPSAEWPRATVANVTGSSEPENTHAAGANAGAPVTTEGSGDNREPGQTEGRDVTAAPGPTQELADSAPQKPTTHQKVVGVDPTRARAKAVDMVKKLTGKSCP